ncbi:putative polyketide synthase [Polychaeton citri CBS 116435]|uniref:Polyketide synthase n=1 Tax=Polychaeton citri CBS 116435 TaxID=1314669 RepID=A0A9P4UQK5_9PEZI|nr:putative polyketide synthase [Polychaeton citri CBS 116435]
MQLDFSKVSQLRSANMGEFPPPPTTIVGTDLSDSQFGNSVEPIAIIGIGCRFPGGASDSRKLWKSLIDGRSAWSEVPSERFNMEAFQHPQNPEAGTTNTSGGHFLSGDISAFDASFFGINPVEARAMDPQQRLMLEVAYESFENAGITPKQLWSSNTGVYVGQWTSDYAEILSRDTEYPATYHTTGVGPAITSNRISYHFNLLGPSYTVDAGCSASLVALHAAVQSLRSRETDMSFVGGVNLLLDPQRFTYQSKLRMFSTEGKSFSFDSRANGYGRGEGCSGVVLKPLAAALRDGDRVRAVLRNCVLNQDGRTPGISVPSGDAQQRAIRKAYADAGLKPSADYVEAHGTGTAVGDPIEVSAIASVLGVGRDPKEKLPIGSIKANIGHTESAAGLAGLVKAVLMLEMGGIPPQANFDKVNEKITLNEWNLRIPNKFERSDLRRISVNSFGYGGTNAHVIVDSAAIFSTPAVETEDTIGNSTSPTCQLRPRVLIVSAKSERSCHQSIESLAEYVREIANSEFQGSRLDQLVYTVNKRALYKHQAVVVANSASSCVEQLNSLVQKPIPAREVRDDTRVGYIFSGQGAQYYNMARGLITTWPHFNTSLQRANRCLASLGCSWDLLEELRRDEQASRLDDPSLGQPLSTTIQLALVDAFASLGLFPAAAAGHSSGEIAAAYCAGFLSFEDAIKVSYHRGRLTSELLVRQPHLDGAMLAVGTSSELAEKQLALLDPNVGSAKIACYNSPSSVTLSGNRSAIESLSKQFEDQSIFNRVLKTNGAAYHSKQMNRIEGDYYEALEGIETKEDQSKAIMVSSLTGSIVMPAKVDRSYWVKNLVSPVLFEDAMWELCQDSNGRRNVDLVLEVGPHSQLEGPVNQIIQCFQGDSAGITYVPSLRRNMEAAEAISRCIGHLFGKGVPIDVHSMNYGFQRRHMALLADLPPYSFDHQSTFWHESRLSKDYRHRKFLPHELLGNLSPDINQMEPRWRRYIRLKDLPWLRGHTVQGEVVFPAAGYLAMATEAIRRHTKMLDIAVNIQGYEFHNVGIGKAMVIADDIEDQEICLSFKPDARSTRSLLGSWMDFKIFTVSKSHDWVEHCCGLIRARVDNDDALSIRGEESAHVLRGSKRRIGPSKFYYHARDVGIDWRSPFDNITDLRLGPDTCISNVRTPDAAGQRTPDGGEAIYAIHPATLDACLFHGPFAIQVLELGLKNPFVPVSIRNMYISAQYDEKPQADLTCYIAKTDEPLTFNVTAGTTSPLDGKADQIVLRASGIMVAELPGSINVDSSSHNLCLSVDWMIYCQSMTERTVDRLCKSDLQRESIVEENELFRTIALFHIRHALQEVSLDEVPEGHLRLYYEWMSLHVDDEYNESLLSTHKIPLDEHVAIEALGKIGPKLASILKDECEPLAILSNNKLFSKIYSETSSSRCYSQMAAYCTELGKQTPEMKVLEIGAGTGSATEPILRALCNKDRRLISSYTFSDISPGFFEAARTRLADFADILDYQVLDVEQAVTIEAEGSYDLVIACNVIHATSSVGASLDRIRSLLCPGGLFMLMEITEEQLHINLVFGCLSGWWAGSEEGRRSSPLLTAPRWLIELQAHGFDYPSALLRDYEEAEGGTMTVFVCKASTVTGAPEEIPVEVITEGASNGKSTEITESLQNELSNYQVAQCPLMSRDYGGVISIIPPHVCHELVSNMTAQRWDDFKDRLVSSVGILLITRGATGDCQDPIGAMITGFARCFRQEHQDIRVVTLDMSLTATSAEIGLAAATLLRSPSFDLNKNGGEIENEFSEDQGQLFVCRVMPEKCLDTYIQEYLGTSQPRMASFLATERNLTAQLSMPGLLETLSWVDDINSPAIGPDEIQFELRAASINFKDVLIAAGQLPGVTDMRNDCSGIVTEVGDNMRIRFKKGDRVCGYYSRSYTNRPRVHGDCCAVIPDRLSFEEGASLPIVWGTVYYCLVDKGRLSKGERLLVHSAAGAVGQAAIMLAQHIGAEVFATVSSDEKKQFLIQTYGVAEDHILSSRSTAFGSAINLLTNGHGADVILNSLGGEMFRETCNSIAAYGRFVEIGRKDFLDDMPMPSRFLLKNVTFAYVDLALLIEEKRSLVRRVLHDVVDLIAVGAIHPTTITTWPISEIETAFRHIQARKHIGKVILTVEDNQLVKIAPPSPPLAQLKPNGVYLVVGGLGGLGKEIVKWLADRGAGQIVTLSRSGKYGCESATLVDSLKTKGITVLPKSCDVSSMQSVSAVMAELEESKTLWPVRGVIQSAMVLKDSTFNAMTYEKWVAAVAPKVAGSWNLHSALPHNLDFFIMMSSVCAISGNSGQSNYSAACSYQDALARFRNSRGQAAYSINISVVADNGFVSEHPEVSASLRRQGIGTITTAELLAHLNFAVTHSFAESPKASQCVLGLMPTGNEPDLGQGPWKSEARFRYFQKNETFTGKSAKGLSDTLQSIHTAKTLGEAQDLVCQAVLEQLSKLIVTPVERLSESCSLDDYGVDSLVAVELRNWIGAYLQANVPMLTLRSTRSVRELAVLIVKDSSLVCAKE